MSGDRLAIPRPWDELSPTAETIPSSREPPILSMLPRAISISPGDLPEAVRYQPSARHAASQKPDHHRHMHQTGRVVLTKNTHDFHYLRGVRVDCPISPAAGPLLVSVRSSTPSPAHDLLREAATAVSSPDPRPHRVVAAQLLRAARPHRGV
jgi:hypothetical protein